MEDKYEGLLFDVLESDRKRIKQKNIVIIVLLSLLLIQPIALKVVDNYYDSKYDYVTTEQEKEDVIIETEGDNANAEYNKVNGDQYNDNSTHSESN